MAACGGQAPSSTYLALLNAGVVGGLVPAQPPGGSAAADGAEGWLCDTCGNHNYADRIYCNMRKCGAPGPWTCPACGNCNFAHRDVCNRKSCAQPRPGPLQGPAGTAGPAAAWLGGPGHGGVVLSAQQQEAAAQAMALLQSSGLSAIPGVEQGISKIAQSLNEAFAASAVPVALQMVPGAAPAGVITGACKAEQSSPPEGAWVCLGCGNINFPDRAACNAKLCGRPRQEVDGGPPKANANMRSLFFPGSWVCGACKYVNYPRRDTCGRSTCGKPRGEVDAGPPTPQQQQMKEGSWTCRQCGNLNFPDRTICNKRTCGQPREL